MRTKKIIAVLLAAITVLCSVQFSVFAADAEVLIIDGERTAIVSSFGKMTYNGKSYTSFRSFNDALAALGAEGGKIVFNGTIELGNFTDISGRGPVNIVGTGTSAHRNILSFSGGDTPVTELNLAGALSLRYMSTRFDNGAYILTNGYTFKTETDYDAYMTAQFVQGQSNIVSYPNLPSIAPGKVSGKAGAITLSSGKFTAAAAGSARGAEIAGDTSVIISGAEVETVIAGNTENGTMTGKAYLAVSDGVVKKVVAGTLAGTLNGNSVTEISGGDIGEIVIGAAEGSTINGNVVVKFNTDYNGTITSAGGTVTGKKVIVIKQGVNVSIPDGVADYIITTSGANIEPVSENGTFKGFSVTDKLGTSSESISVNGAAVAASGGLFTFAEGKSTVEATSSISIALNKNANYVAGYEDGTFRPQNNMTKAEAITLLARTIVDETKISGIACSVNGVEAGQWYVPYIGLFEKLGYLDLVMDNVGTSLDPNKNITRAEFTQLIYEISELIPSSDKGKAQKLAAVADVDSSNDFYPAVSYAMTNGIVTGYEDGTFRPGNSITRAEVVTMVNRFLGRIPTGTAGTTSFSDTTDHWANAQVLAACNPEGISWNAKSVQDKYVLTGTTSKEYVVGLYDQSSSLSADAILEGIDVISEKMKQDILGTPNTADIYGDRMTGQIYYISEKSGSDDNDGKTPETAFKTIAGYHSKVRFPKRGTSLLFERGGVYRGTLSVMPGMTFGSYGTGEKPLLMQSKKNYADPALWVETKWENVWKCTDKLSNVGIIAFDHDIYDHSETTYHEKLGIMANAHVGGFLGVDDLDTDLQFYSVLDNDATKTGSVAVNDLYMYSTEGNPGSRFSSIEIGEKTHIISGSHDDVVIDNLALKFVGGHGISMGTVNDRVITNCVISYIGGSILATNFRDSGSPVNYGNAIEVYGGCDGYYVENCWIYQIFDTAITHQFAEETACTQERIRYYGNLMEYCFWSIEFYNSLGTNTATPATKYTKDVHISHNVINKTGYGWGSIGWGDTGRSRTGFVYCGSGLATNEDELTEYNVFNQSSGHIMYLPPNSNEVDDKNFYIQKKGNLFGRLKEYQDTYFDYDAAQLALEKLGDENAVVIIIE